MRVFALILAACLVLAAHEAAAQAVQLPTFSFTTVTTTVSVPDRGAAYLGGINRAATARNEFGLPGIALPGFQNRSIGQDRSASNMFVTATIHDFDAMDQALLGADTSGLASLSRNPQRSLPQIAPMIPARNFQLNPVNLAGQWHADSAPAAAPVKDLATEQAGRADRQLTRADEADSFFARGQQAEADGKPDVAKIYYQMAARRATGDLKAQVLARLDAVGGRSNAVAKSVP